MSTLTFRHSPSDGSHDQNHVVSDLVQLKSTRVAWEVLAMLSHITETSELKNTHYSCRRFKGKVTHSNFKLTYASLWNPFIRTMHGRVMPMNGGCLIQYRMEMSAAARIIFGVWFTGILMLAFSKIGNVVLHGITAGGYDDFVMLFILVCGSLYIGQIMLSEGRAREREIEFILSEITQSRQTPVLV